MTAVTAGATPLLSPRRAWALAGAATLTMAVSYVDRQTLAILAPRVSEKLDIGEQGYSLLASAFSIAYLIGAPLAGRAIDRIGARRGLLWAVLLWSAVAALHAIVPGFAVLFVLRILLGLAESPSFPGAAQTIHRVLPPASRARGFGLLFTGSSIGATLTAPLATWLERTQGWRAAFLVTAGIGLLWVPMWLALTSGSAARAAMDRVAAPTAAPRTPARQILLHPAFLRGAAVMAASAPVFAFVLLWGAKYLVRDHHLTQGDVGRFLWVPTLAFDGGAILFGHLASKRPVDTQASARGLLTVSMLLCASLALGPLMGGPWAATIVCAVAMIGGGGLYAIHTADVLARVPVTDVSTASGLLAAVQSLAFIIANPIIGATVARTHSYTTAMIAMGAWVIPGCVLWLVIPPPPLTPREAA